jgi:hypothetical protein
MGREDVSTKTHAGLYGAGARTEDWVGLLKAESKLFVSHIL